MLPSKDWYILCSGFNLLNRGTTEMGRTCMIHWGILAFSHRFSGPGSLFVCFSSVEVLFLFSRSVMSDSLWPHGLQHIRFPCPSPTPRVCSNSCPLSQWCHPTISSSVSFSSRPQSFPVSVSFPMNQRFSSGSLSIGVSASHQSFQWISRVDFL